jgi:DNA polymerase-3 subunit gamma/tau
MRDAESMLDQVVAFCGTTIGAADVHNVFGFTPRETVLELAGALVARDTPAALAVVKSQAEAGKDLARLLGDLVGLLRDILIGKVHPSAEATEEASLGEAISQEKLLVLLDHFGEAEGRLRWATDKKLQLDVALIKGVHLLEEASLSDVLDTLTALRGGAPLPDRPAARPSAPRPASPVAAPAPAPSPAPVPKPAPLPVDPIRTEPPQAESKTAPIESPVDGTSLPGSGAAPAGLTTSVVRGSSQSLGSQPPTPSSQLPTPISSDPWQDVAMKLAADSPLKFGWVEDGRFIERIGNAILVEFPPSLERQTQTLFWPQAVKKIEEQLTAALGVKITFEYRFTGEEPPALPEPEPIAASAPPTKEASEPNRTAGKATGPALKQTAPEPAAPPISAAELEEFKSDPLIRKALEIFKAEILIDPPQKA